MFYQKKVNNSLTKMWKTLFICGFIGFCQAQNACITPDGGNGICKSVYACPIVHKLAERAMNDTSLRPQFQRYRCGPKPLVCCPDCFTPDGQGGICKHLDQCPHLKRMSTEPITQSIIRYLSYSYSLCVDADSYCCGPPPPPTVVGGCERRMSAFPPDPATECSGVEASAANRILGGNETDLDQYPWVAILEYQIDGKIILNCGGALISGKYVLTAAHCIVPEKPTGVRLGEYDIGTPSPNCRGVDCQKTDCIDEDCADPTQSIPIEESIVHEEYNDATLRNDIALIRLKDMAPFTDFIRPISLPTFDVTLAPSKTPLRAVVCGWGRVNKNIIQSRYKQQLEVPIVDTQECQEAYYHQFGVRAPSLWSLQLCAGGEPGKDSCNGDSGGPLMMRTNYEGKRIYELIGVVSQGPDNCGTQGVPGIYTKVYRYLDWIRSNIMP